MRKILKNKSDQRLQIFFYSTFVGHPLGGLFQKTLIELFKMSGFQNSFYWKAIFFLSGCSSLIYQVTFTKFFIPVLGLSLPAMTVVVSSFFSGMAIGSWLAPSLIKWNRCTPIFYALIEMAIGLLSVLVVYAKPLLFSLYSLYSDDNFASTYQVFFSVFIIILISFAIDIDDGTFFSNMCRVIL